MDINTVQALEPARVGAWTPGDAWLAGGTWLFSQPQPDTVRLLDLQSFGWEPLVTDDEGLTIASTCTFTDLARWSPPTAWQAGSLVSDCCRALLGSFKIWNAATVGGNICLALPAGPMTSLASALDGTLEIWRPDGSSYRRPVIDFVVGASTTTLGPGELVRSVHLPARSLSCVPAFRQTSLSPYGRSAAVVIGRLDPTDGSVVVTISASTPRPIQLRFDYLPSIADARTSLADTVDSYYDDVHGHPVWRAAITAQLVDEVVIELSMTGGSR